MGHLSNTLYAPTCLYRNIRMFTISAIFATSVAISAISVTISATSAISVIFAIPEIFAITALSTC